MIGGRIDPPPGPFARVLASQAGRIAAARIENRIRARRRDPWRWRLARLLWPDIAGE